MFITSLDMAGIMIALVVSTTLVITTAVRNASMHKEIIRLRRLVNSQR